MKAKSRARGRWWSTLVDMCGHHCPYCGVRMEGKRMSRLTVDHFVPLNRGGTNRLENLMPACSRCNTDKGDSEPYVWMRRKGIDIQRIEDLRERWCTFIWTKFRTIEKQRVLVEA